MSVVTRSRANLMNRRRGRTWVTVNRRCGS